MAQAIARFADIAPVAWLDVSSQPEVAAEAAGAATTAEVVYVDPLIEESRRRPSSRLSRREWRITAISAAAFIAVAVAMPLVFSAPVSPSMATATMFVVVYAMVSLVEFEIGTGSAVPTQLVLVPMLFVLPPATVPLAVASGYALAALVDLARGDLRAQRMPVLLSTCWYAVGPALVLAIAGESRPSWDHWPVYLAALAAQFLFDLVSSTLREWLAFGIAPSSILRFMEPVFLVDALLSPAGLVTAFAVAPHPYALLATLPTVFLIWLFARDRRHRIDQALALSHAYQGANEEARRDALTGLVNRLGWDEAVQAEQYRLSATGRSASVIILDVDGLKAANDERGHDFGDLLIQELAGVVASTVRENDVVARIGGDEFAVLLPASRQQDCTRTVARLTQAIAGRRVEGVPLSASIGYATSPPAPTLADALHAADARMYEVKRRAGAVRSR